MAAQELRERLQSLTIPQNQRPVARGRGGVLGWIVLAGIAFVGGGLAWRQGPAARSMLIDRWLDPLAEAPTRVVVREPPPPVPVLTATGRIVSDHRVQVVTKVSGQVIELAFEQGDRVERGQILARLEDVNYRARRDQAAAMLARSRAVLAYEEVNHQRILRLFESQQASDIEMADAQRALDEARAQVAADQAQLDGAQKALADCVVTAPIAGVVLERNVEVGDFVAAEGGRGANANAQFATIADMRKLRVEVDVSELDIARVRPNMPCRITPDAYRDRAYAGVVMWIDPGANYAKATVQVKVRINDPDEYLRIEGTAQVAFLPEPEQPALRARADSIWVPEAAVYLGPGGEPVQVWVVESDGRVRPREVEIGERRGTAVELLAGLEEGQRIVVSGVERLRVGQRVRLAVDGPGK